MNGRNNPLENRLTNGSPKQERSSTGSIDEKNTRNCHDDVDNVGDDGDDLFAERRAKSATEHTRGKREERKRTKGFEIPDRLKKVVP